MKRLICSLACLALWAAVGCEKSEPEKPAAEIKAGDVSIDIKAPSGAETILLSADAIDGTSDKIVSKCAGCALGMDGKSEFALQSHGYTLYFCSAECKDGFAKDMEASVLAIKVPAK